jgi:hypothetical protein
MVLGALLLRAIRMRQRPLMVEHHAEIAAIDPRTARLAFDEVLGLVVRRVDRFADIFSARNFRHSSRFSFRRPRSLALAVL